MTLTQDLANLRDRLRANHSDDIKATMDRATEELVDSGLVNRSLAVGATVPNFTLPDATGQEVELASLLENGPVILSFYRGGWCPYCNMELRGLQQALPQIRELGATLVAVSPETPDNSLTTAEKNDLSFPVLSDAGNVIARELGLVFTVPEDLRPIYATLGLDIPAYNGDDTFELPVPATYVIEPSGRVAYAFANADYTQRLDPAAILSALRGLHVSV